MARWKKRLERMRNNPRDDWRYEEVAAILERCGFNLVSSSGSHRTWKHPFGPRITIPDRGAAGLDPPYIEAVVAAVDEVMQGKEEA